MDRQKDNHQHLGQSNSELTTYIFNEIEVVSYWQLILKEKGVCLSKQTILLTAKCALVAVGRRRGNYRDSGAPPGRAPPAARNKLSTPTPTPTPMCESLFSAPAQYNSTILYTRVYYNIQLVA
ncbi:hypothetical protein EVAR_54146_1 [Eumeta japonica]|uniref:Uncharacterized protein n=1 Tax=Eumeta variegata TaxID=151549 RepID=A0A4C1XZZ3_EUMVA|nr:hypothetical protein EVAR_54146_1 [Eumeta japonica]